AGTDTPVVRPEALSTCTVMRPACRLLPLPPSSPDHDPEVTNVSESGGRRRRGRNSRRRCGGGGAGVFTVGDAGGAEVKDLGGEDGVGAGVDGGRKVLARARSAAGDDRDG